LVAQTAFRRGQEAASEAVRLRNTLAQQIAEAKAALARSQQARAEQVAAADSTLDRIMEVRPVDLVAAEAEVSQAQAAEAKAAADLEQTYVRASEDGMILKVYTRAGEKVAPEGIVDLGQTQRMVAVVEVYESDVRRVRVGMPTTVVSDAIGGDLKGQVLEIGRKVLRQSVVNTDPTSNTDARVVEVRIGLDEASSRQGAAFTNSQVTAKIWTDGKGSQARTKIQVAQEGS
jgi:HlyD family secretion protein